MNLVTAEGRLVRASSEENPDLFWGLRGGGGNFGVVTGIDYRLYPVGPEIVGGIVAWPASDAPGVLELYRTLAEQAPPELTLVALMRLAPPAPWLPKEIHGKPIVAILACYTGRCRGGREGGGAHQVVRQAGGRHAGAAALRADAVAARRHPAQGPALLLEERVPAAHRARALRTKSWSTQPGSARPTRR